MKHFIHLNDFTRQEAVHIFALADKLRQNAGAASLLSGKTIVLFFPESSIRTRVSFEKASNSWAETPFYFHRLLWIKKKTFATL